MNVRGQLVVSFVALGLSLALSTLTMAQGARGGGPAAPATPQTQAPTTPAAPAAPPASVAPTGGGGRGNFVPEPVPPAQQFKTSTEHYAFLMRLHKGGTRHTYDTVPKWEGLWSAAGNTATTFFLKGTEIVPGVLTPAYEAAFKMRRSLGAEYDRLTRCEPAGYPRWLLEPYVREFVNTPTQSWWPNDLANDTRRIYINQDHKNIDGTHSAEGDSVGFWVNDMLIVHTIHLHPGDYFRGQPPTSNQFESVEVWRMIAMANGEPRLSVNVTFYDPDLARAAGDGGLHVQTEYRARGGRLPDAALGVREQPEHVPRDREGRTAQHAVPPAGRPRVPRRPRRGPQPQPRPAEGPARPGQEPDLRRSAEVGPGPRKET